jgi:hypothetical protein
MEELLRKYKKNELNTRFQQNFTTGSYGVRIGCAWCSWKACEICSSLVQKKKLIFKNFSSHTLPKQQSTSFWSRGILGVKQIDFQTLNHMKNKYLKYKMLNDSSLNGTSCIKYFL